MLASHVLSASYSFTVVHRPAHDGIDRTFRFQKKIQLVGSGREKSVMRASRSPSFLGPYWTKPNAGAWGRGGFEQLAGFTLTWC